MYYQVYRDDFMISTDPGRLNIGFVHAFLSMESHWAKGIPLATVQRSIEHSLCFGVFAAGEQIGFARVISDFATIAYLGDVFITKSYRGRGLSQWLMEAILLHPGLQGMRRWILVTADAHGLYEKYGFRKLKSPEQYMELLNPNVYAQNR